MVNLTVAGADADLDERLGTALTSYNEDATGVRDQREVTVKVVDGSGDVVAGLSGWTCGYVERGRSEGSIPHAGAADVHFVTRLEPADADG